jgi:hypothetical protein
MIATVKSDCISHTTTGGKEDLQVRNFICLSINLATQNPYNPPLVITTKRFLSFIQVVNDWRRSEVIY